MAAPTTPTTGLEPLLGPDELSQFYRIPKSSLYSWRTRGIGPKGIRIGKHLRYRKADVLAWLEEQEADA